MYKESDGCLWRESYEHAMNALRGKCKFCCQSIVWVKTHLCLYSIKWTMKQRVTKCSSYIEESRVIIIGVVTVYGLDTCSRMSFVLNTTNIVATAKFLSYVAWFEVYLQGVTALQTATRLDCMIYKKKYLSAYWIISEFTFSDLGNIEIRGTGSADG